MSENTHTLTAADFADILSTTLAMAAEAGLSVGVRNRPGDNARPAGLLIFIEGLRATTDGRLITNELPPQNVKGDATIVTPAPEEPAP